MLLSHFGGLGSFTAVPRFPRVWVTALAVVPKASEMALLSLRLCFSAGSLDRLMMCCFLSGGGPGSCFLIIILNVIIISCSQAVIAH